MSSRQLQVVLDLDSAGYSSKMGAAGTVTKEFGATVKTAGGNVQQLGQHIDNTSQITSGSLQHLRDYVITIAGIEAIVSSLGHTIAGAMEAAISMSAQLERQTILMKGLSQAPTEAGKLTEANKDMAELFDLSKKSGYAVDTLATAFVRLKSTGMDPMQGSMQSMVDAVAAFGGDTNVMNHVALALQEMADKGTLSMKELRRQFAIFVPDGMRTMAEVLGLTMDEMTKKISSGAVAAKPAMELMLRQLGIVHAGAAERMAETLKGQMNTFHTNMIQMAGDFTGQLEASRIQAEREVAIQTGDKQKLRELDEQEAHAKSLYATIKQIMAEINTGMQGVEGRNAFRKLGEDIAVVVREIANVARFLIQYRQEVMAVGEVMTFVFATKLITAWGTTMLQMLTQAAQSTRALFAVEAETIPSAMQMRMESNFAILEGVRANQDLLNSTRELMGIQAENAAQQEQYARLQAEEASQELRNAEAQVQAMRAQQEARISLVASMEREEQAALQQLQTGRSITGQFVTRTAALTEYQAATSRLAAAETMLARTDAELMAAESRVTTALEAKSAAMGIATTATEAASLADAQFMAAESAATAELTIFDTAAAAATIAVDALSMAVKFALGPWGILIGIVLTAAQAMGAFTTKADEAAAAADRARHHMAEAGDEGKLEGQELDLQKQINDLNSSRGADGTVTQHIASPYGGNDITMSKADVDREINGLQTQLTDVRSQRKTLLTDYWSGLANDAESEAKKGVTQLTQRMYQADAQLRANIAKIQDPDQRQKTSQKLDMLEQNRVAGFNQQAVAGLEAKRKATKDNTLAAQELDAALGDLRHSTTQESAASLQSELAHGANAKGAKAAAGALDKLGMSNAEAQAKAKGLGTELAKVNYEIEHGMGGFGKMSEAQKDSARNLAASIDAAHAAMRGMSADKSFDQRLDQAAGKIAELRAKLVDGNTTEELAKFNAEVAGGMFKGVTQDRINQMREYAKIIDGLSKETRVKDFGDKLDTDLVKATKDADSLWTSFQNGTLKSDKTADRLRASLEAQLIALKLMPAEAAKFEAVISKIVQETERGKLADLMQKMQDETNKNGADLSFDSKKKNVDLEFAQAVHQRFLEVVASNNSINASDKNAATQRKQLWAGYFAWYASEEKKRDRANEGALVTQARQWSDLAANLQQAYASIAGSFVEMLSSGKMDVKKFAIDILKEIAKVIIEALIAYTILSAIGMTPKGTNGQKLNFGQYLGQGITNSFKMHEGGIIGQPTNMSGNYPSSLWDNAQRYHTGGIIGLQPNEVPIIGLKGERVLTEDEQNKLGNGANTAPAVTVNVVNNGKDELHPDVSTHWDGKEMIVSVVLEAASKQGPFRDALMNMGSKK